MLRQKSLWPREHGAYVQLLAPLAAALAARAPTAAGVLLALAACLAFVAHEPLLVVLGSRGARRREVERGRALHRLVVLAGGAASAALAGLALATPATLAVAALVALACGGVIALAWRRAEHTLGGELAAATALAGAAAPVAIAEGAEPRVALATWLVWTIGYACTVIAVHRVLARHRVAAGARDRWIAVALATVALAAAAAMLVFAPLAGIALPLAVVACALSLRPPPANRLRAIGFVLVGASLASGTWLVAMAWCR